MVHTGIHTYIQKTMHRHTYVCTYCMQLYSLATSPKFSLACVRGYGNGPVGMGHKKNMHFFYASTKSYIVLV